MATTITTPVPVRHALRDFGNNVTAWRKLQGLTAAQVAERAGVSRGALRRVEQGEGGASMEVTLRVLRSLGIMDLVVSSVDPYNSDVGRLRSQEILPKRVRRSGVPGTADG